MSRCDKGNQRIAKCAMRSDFQNFRMTRREFITGLCTAGACASLAGMASSAMAFSEAVSSVMGESKRSLGAGVTVIRAAFLRPPGKYWFGWPGTAYPVEQKHREFSQKLSKWASKVGVRILMDENPLTKPKDVERFINEVKATKPDAILLTLLHMNQWRVTNQIVDAYTPAIIFAPIGVSFTGHIGAISRKEGVYLVSSLDFDAVGYGLRMVKAMRMLKHSCGLFLVGNRTVDREVKRLGVTLRYVPRNRFVEEFKRVKESPQVIAIADEYMRRARAIKEPTRKDVLIAARMYIASLNLLRAERANAITMDCLGLEAARLIPGPPCLAWSKLLDEGTVAACEGDVGALLTHMVVLYLFDKPGFQQDPVSETVHNTWIGAHCTSPTRLKGLHEPPEPFILRSHAESNQGVSLQVLWREGQKVTIADFEGAGPDHMLIGTGTVIRNIETPPAGGCRTSIECVIDNCPDSRNVRGFHQIVFYGDHARELAAFCQLVGIKVEPLVAT